MPKFIVEGVVRLEVPVEVEVEAEDEDEAEREAVEGELLVEAAFNALDAATVLDEEILDVYPAEE